MKNADLFFSGIMKSFVNVEKEDLLDGEEDQSCYSFIFHRQGSVNPPSYNENLNQVVPI